MRTIKNENNNWVKIINDYNDNDRINSLDTNFIKNVKKKNIKYFSCKWNINNHNKNYNKIMIMFIINK